MSKLAFTSALCVIQLLASNAIAANLNGLAISKNHVYGLHDGQMSRRTCRTVPRYKIDVLNSKQLKVTVDGRTALVPVTRSSSSYKGVRVHIYQVERFPWKRGTPSPLHIIVPKNNRYNIYIVDLIPCPAAGYTANSAEVLISPTNRGNLDAWLSANNSIHIGDGAARNSYWIDLPTGHEDRLIKDLRSRDWVLDAVREGYPAGPDEVFLFFPLRSLLSGATRQTELRDKLFNAIRSRFEGLISKQQIMARRGYQYTLDIKGRAKDILSDDRFRNRWLETKIKIDVTTTGTVDGPIGDRIILSIPDGFLPVWPDSQTNPPPAEHTQEFHLTPDAEDNFKNFRSLEKLQTIVAGTLASELNGEVEFDPYAE